MLEMRGGLAVSGNDGPAVVENFHLVGTHINHGLDRENEARFDLRAFSILNVVQYRRIFVQGAADAMATEITNDSVIVRFSMLLHGCGNICNVVAGYGLLD